MNARMSEVIGRCYDAALDPSCWTGITADIARAFNATSAALAFHTPEGKAVLTDSTTNFEPCARDPDWADYWLQRDPWARAARAQGVPTIAIGEELVGTEDLERSGFYNEFARSLDIHYVVGALFPGGGSGTGMIAIHRPRESESFDASDRRNLAALLPHLRRATSLQRLLKEQVRSLNASVAALEFIRAAVFVTDRHRRVQYLNDAAEAWLRTHPSIHVSQGTLTSADSYLLDRLSAVVSRAACIGTSASDWTDAEPIAVSRTANSSPTVLWAMPFRPRLQGSELCCGEVLLVVREPQLRATPLMTRRLLQEVYSLTPREIDLVTGLLRGEAVAQLSVSLGISIGHLRQRLKSVFMKVGVSSQSQLVVALSHLD